MLGSAIVQYLGLTPGLWTEWIVSFVFALVGSVLLRNLIWLFWPTLRKISALKKSGHRLDLILIFSLLMAFSANIPAPIYGNALVTWLLKVFFVVLIFRQWDLIGEGLLKSQDFCSKLVPVLRRRLHFVFRIFLLIIALNIYGSEYVPLAAFNSSMALLVLTAGFVFFFPVLRDVSLGFFVLSLRNLDVGHEITILTKTNSVTGKISEIHWTHLVLECSDSTNKKVFLRWHEVYFSN